MKRKPDLEKVEKSKAIVHARHESVRIVMASLWNNTSGHTGVYPRGRSWIDRIRVFGKNKHLGSFDKKEDAEKAYDDAAIQHFGEFYRKIENQG